MIIKKLFLKDFKSYGSVNGEPIEVDFTKYEKFAIVGNNGAGKSTLIDAITFALYGRAAVSETKEIGSKELINDKADETYVKFVFEKDGLEYIIERNLRRTSGVSAGLTIDGTPVDAHGVNDVNDTIYKILGMDYESFVSSTIIRQGELERLTSKTPADRKRSFINIFGLDIYDRFAELAKERQRNTETNMMMNQTSIQEKEAIVKKEPEIRRDIKVQEEKERSLSIELSKLQAKLQQIIRKRDIYHLKKIKYETTKKESESTVIALKREMSILEDLDADIGISKTAESELKTLTPKFQEFKVKEKRLEALRKDKEEYDTARHRKTMAESAIDHEMEKITKELSSVIEDIKRLQDENRIKSRKMKGLEGFSKASDKQMTINRAQILEIKSKREKTIEDLSRIENDMGQADFQFKELSDNKNKLEEQKIDECPVCKQHLKKLTKHSLIKHYLSESRRVKAHLRGLIQKQSKLNALKKSLEVKLDLKERYSTELQGKRTELGRLSEIKSRIEQIEKELTEKRKRKEILKGVLSKETYAIKEREMNREATKVLKELDFDLPSFRMLDAFVSKNKGMEGRKSKLETEAKRLPELLKSLKAQKGHISALTKKNKSVNNILVHLKPFADKYEEFEEQRSETEDVKGSVANEHAACKARIDGSKKRLDELRKFKSDIKKLQSDIRRQSIEIQAYKRLQEEIFGRDGIPTEILRHIIPEIESESSDLLGRLSNGKLLITMDFSNKDEIRIQATDINGEHPVFRFSGGERTRINLALRLGISEVIAKRKGSRGKLETIVLDECFGTLDTEGRMAVIEVINSLMERFTKVIVISHLEDIKDAFDTKLLVENTSGYSKLKYVS